MTLDARDRALAAWLWARGEATLVGHSAAAMHGTKWLPSGPPAELGRTRHRAPPGIIVNTGAPAEDEVCLRASIDCTTPARTAYDIGRRVTGEDALIRIARYPGARGIKRLRSALELVDGGAESPKETELRLLLVRDALPRPVTQILVRRGCGR